MSTKATIDHGDGHHLYVDWVKPGVIAVRLEGVPFVATPDSVTVEIPLALWDRLRGHGVRPEDYWDEESEDAVVEAPRGVGGGT